MEDYFTERPRLPQPLEWCRNALAALNARVRGMNGEQDRDRRLARELRLTGEEAGPEEDPQ